MNGATVAHTVVATDWDHSQRVYQSPPMPPPTDTPYRTPTAAMSRRSLPRRNSSSGNSRSSSPLSPDQEEHEGRNNNLLDAGRDESISILDPRRFTPTLHASLVSEILSLRRDLENKVKEMDSLEVNLDSSKTEADELQATLAKTAKENRSLKRQLQLLEGGSLSAMTELAKERDEALESIADVRKRLDQSQKKLRTHEEQTEKAQGQWEDERQRWDEERRNLERKVHVVEGRLKLVLNEIAALQADNATRETGGDEASVMNDTPIRSGSVIGRRRTSTASSIQDAETHGRFSRASVMSIPNGYATKSQGVSLADELAFDEDEEDDDHISEMNYERPDSRATVSNDSHYLRHSMGSKARRILGLSLENTDHGLTAEMLLMLREAGDQEDDAKTISQSRPTPQYEYRDMGIQYTPPPSPPPVNRERSASADTSTIFIGLDAATSTSHETATDERQNAYETIDTGVNTEPVGTISSACQTVTVPSPPRTPDEQDKRIEPLAVQTTSCSTQTDEPVPVKEKRPPRHQIPIPVIAVHPPGSNPPSPRSSVVLPPQTKSVSCQTELEAPTRAPPPPPPSVRSCSVQTEEIRLDNRPIKLAANLLPSAIHDQPPPRRDIPESQQSPPLISPYCPPPPRSAKRRVASPKDESFKPDGKGKQPETIQAYPGNNDNGPLAEDEKSHLRRPFRSSSLFAGFEQSSDEEQQSSLGKDFDELLSEDELIHKPMASYTLRYGKMVSKPAPSTILDEPEDEGEKSPKSPAEAPVKPKLQRSGARSKSTAKRPPRLKQPDIRRAAMISSSSAAHQMSRPRSPSAPSFGSSHTGPVQQPPFPVPIRLSSRKVPTSSSEGAQSPSPYQTSFPGDFMRSSTREPLRKVRSDVAVTRLGRMDRMDRRRSDSPPTLSVSSIAPDSPIPPLPFDDITAPQKRRGGGGGRQQRPKNSVETHNYAHSRDDSTSAAAVQQTSVVDAIAQTMIGEWMWKYVRRRKSFGMPENSRDQWETGKSTDELSANISGSGIRHQRWVWLAPYERSVMWSSKQPISGHALLGKTGRKLIIQSVLDVKDDNPLPKGSSQQAHFGRSILILTPQRALKFTALTLERHFVWLTALSFLSHSSMNLTDLAALPPVPQEEYTQRQPAPALRRNPIRDSIRVAKGKSRWNKPFATQTPAVPEIPVDAGGAAYGHDLVPDAADPPNVPRFSSHTRKRSNTAPRPLPGTFRSFSNNVPAPSMHSTTTAGSSELYSPTSIGPPGIHSGRSSVSYRTSEASGPSRTGPTGNFFDAVGTIRMEAFVDRAELPRPRRTQRPRHGGRRKEPPSCWPQSPDMSFPRSERWEEGSSSDPYFRHDDPFRGF